MSNFLITLHPNNVVRAVVPAGNELARAAVGSFGYLLRDVGSDGVRAMVGVSLTAVQFAGLILANNTSPQAKIMAFELLRIGGYPPVIDVLSGRASVRWYRPGDVGFTERGNWQPSATSYPLRRSSATVGNSLPAVSLQGDAANPAYPIASAWGV